jgi:hypothetical protein
VGADRGLFHSTFDVGRSAFSASYFNTQLSTLNWLLILPALIESLFGAEVISFSA